MALTHTSIFITTGDIREVGGMSRSNYITVPFGRVHDVTATAAGRETHN